MTLFHNHSIISYTQELPYNSFITYTVLSTNSGTISGTFSSTNIPTGFGIQYTSTEVNLTSNILPVEFARFKVQAQRSSILLDWQTASEANSKNFIVEHSIDGQTFVAVGEVPAAGNSDVLVDYNFIHEDPNIGTNYYRLRQQDLDGSFEYSVLRVLNYYNLDKDVTIYPNPTMGQVYIKNQSDKVLNLVIRDLSGKIVYRRKDLNAGAVSIDLSDLPKSMYTLELSDDGFYAHKEKLMILE